MREKPSGNIPEGFLNLKLVYIIFCAALFHACFCVENRDGSLREDTAACPAEGFLLPGSRSYSIISPINLNEEFCQRQEGDECIWIYC